MFSAASFLRACASASFSDDDFPWFSLDFNFSVVGDPLPTLLRLVLAMPPGHDVVLGNSPVVWSQAAVAVDNGRSASCNDLVWLSFSDESSEGSVLTLPLTLLVLV